MYLVLLTQRLEAVVYKFRAAIGPDSRWGCVSHLANVLDELLHRQRCLTLALEVVGDRVARVFADDRHAVLVSADTLHQGSLQIGRDAAKRYAGELRVEAAGLIDGCQPGSCFHARRTCTRCVAPAPDVLDVEALEGAPLEHDLDLVLGGVVEPLVPRVESRERGEALDVLHVHHLLLLVILHVGHGRHDLVAGDEMLKS